MINLGCNDHLVKSWIQEYFFESQKLENTVDDKSTTGMKGLRLFPEPSGTFRNLWALPWTFRNLQEPLGTFRNHPYPVESSGTFRNPRPFPEPSLRLFPEPSGTFRNLWALPWTFQLQGVFWNQKNKPDHMKSFSDGRKKYDFSKISRLIKGWVFSI